MMKIRDLIASQTRNNEDQKFQTKPTFQKVKQVSVHVKSPRARGLKPEIQDISNKESSDFEIKPKEIYTNKNKQMLEKSSSSYDSDDNNTKFFGIRAVVRETVGGYYTQSNEAIERRHKEKQKMHAEQKNNSMDTTISSVTTDSYKTAEQDSFKEKKTSRVINNNSFERYKKNALIKGLLQDAVNYPSSTSSDFLDASSASIIECGMQNLTMDPDASMMYNERMNRYFQSDNQFSLVQSREDEDVLEHPIMHVKYDTEWNNTRLKRKGIEVTYSPREYFMNLDDDGFSFELQKK